ncbi:MAG: glycosyltransferase family 39 protein [Vicinamibacterales bacterium]|jgi:hypothetical protein|nr:glycosyltransferase family 39 protein [Vicinamibacterales bacterium]
MLYQLVALGVIAYLPGAVIFRAPFADRARRAALSAEERGFWGVFISLALSSTIALGLAAAEQYSFERLLAANLAVTLVVALLAHGRLRLGAGTPGPTIGVLAPIALVVLGWWLYFPPAEYIIGGKDPGVYMNEGIQIAQRGTLVTHDPQVESLPPNSRDLFIPRRDNEAYYGLRFMGYFVTDPSAGTVVAQFPHLYPVWIAIGYGVDGLTGARRAVGVWSLLGVLALYFLGRRAVGALPAFAGSLLLAVNVAQVWFSRYPNSELVLQAMLLAALLAFARSHVDEDRFFGPLAATLLGLSLFVRFPAVLAWAAIGGAYLAGVYVGRRPRIGFVAPAVIWIGLATWYFVSILSPYTEQPIGFVLNLRTEHLVLLGAGGAGVVSLLAAARSEALRIQIRRWLPVAVGAVVVLAAAYAYFLRAPGGRLAAHDAFALRTYAAYYLSPYGLVAALLGFVLLVRRSFWQNPAFILTISAFSLFFFYKIRVVPEHFWMARRFLPIILPASTLLIATAAFWRIETPWPSAPRARLRLAGRALIGVVFVGLLGQQYLTASRAVMSHIEYAGVIPKLEELAARFDDEDLLIVESRAASDLHVLALPLAYTYARNVLVLSESRPDRVAFGEYLTWARTQYREIYFMGGGGTDLLSPSMTIEPIGSDRFQVPEYESLWNTYPGAVSRKEFDYGIYRFGGSLGADGTFALDLGTMDDLHVVDFHAKERSASDVTFRWSRDESHVVILNTSADAQTLTIWMDDAGRPDNVIPARVAVYVDEILLGDVRVTTGFQPYAFTIPPDLAASLAERQDTTELTLLSTTWNPGEILGGDDDRDLGVRVDRVEIQ